MQTIENCTHVNNAMVLPRKKKIEEKKHTMYRSIDRSIASRHEVILLLSSVFVDISSSTVSGF